MTPLLNFTTEHPLRPLVRIDGQDYELLAREDFSPLKLRFIFRLANQLEALEALEAPTAADEREYSNLLDKLTRWLLPSAPDGVHAKLTDGQRSAIAVFFLQQQLPMATAPAPAPPAAAVATTN